MLQPDLCVTVVDGGRKVSVHPKKSPAVQPSPYEIRLMGGFSSSFNNKNQIKIN